MKRYIKMLVLVIAAICLFIAGVYFGSYKTNDKLNNLYLKSFYSVAASEVKCKVHLLELIDDNNYILTKNKLENYLDLELANLAVYVNTQPLKQDTDIVEAISIAKKYRSKHPDHRISPVIENSVKKTLDFVKDK